MAVNNSAEIEVNKQIRDAACIVRGKMDVPERTMYLVVCFGKRVARYRNLIFLGSLDRLFFHLRYITRTTNAAFYFYRITQHDLWKRCYKRFIRSDYYSFFHAFQLVFERVGAHRNSISMCCENTVPRIAAADGRVWHE